MARMGEFIAAGQGQGRHPAGVCKTCGVPGRLVTGAQMSVGMGGGAFIPATHPHEADHPYIPSGAPSYPRAPLEQPVVLREHGLNTGGFGVSIRDIDPRDRLQTHVAAEVSGERWANHLQGAPKPPGRVARLFKR